jgi:hypothetical protein
VESRGNSGAATAGVVIGNIQGKVATEKALLENG